ncbi:MAG: hypothetical protein LQ347_004346 [Umbilicaria vellea]|nr:MAG: hypothetical protein LQ347_004346 [Umbilicaria vellea]
MTLTHSKTAPILDQVHIPLTYYPSPEVDIAWRRLSNINTIPLSSADVVKLGIDPSTTAKFPAHFGFGDDAHIGRLDVFHQIHCLNSLRKEIHFDYYFGDKFPDGTRTPSHKSHISHCLEILLEAFMCNANIEPILHYWVDIAEEPFPDFDNNHQCRDFDTVLKWHEEHSVGMSYFRRTMRRPDNVIPRKMSHKYKVLLGVEEDDVTSGFP